MSTRSHTELQHRSTCITRARVLAAMMLTLACASSALAAQGGRRRASPDPSAPARVTVPPVLWESEQVFPLAISRASTLKLTDEQRTQIETIYSQLRAENAPLLDAVDTLRPPRMQLPVPGDGSATTTTIPPPPTPDEIAAVVARRHALGEARAQIHENVRLARDEMTKLMTPDQQARLDALEATARSNAERGDPGGTAPDHSLTGGSRNGRRGGQNGPPSY